MITIFDTLGFGHSITAFAIIRVESIEGGGCVVHMNSGDSITTDTSREAVVELIRNSSQFYLQQTSGV